MGVVPHVHLAQRAQLLLGVLVAVQLDVAPHCQVVVAVLVYHFADVDHLGQREILLALQLNVGNDKLDRLLCGPLLRPPAKPVRDERRKT